ncbi:RNA polymerase sigma factor (sigma-70 family) [Pedobacter africanus]|uniref:RNA polymerase sigma factor (Sigma-70 family) n=1 Tax=Pedobacter africanus TaxID=151894 RepID=A0ACC6L251_9SPHI|nr:sigma-70 family RNA polymerase sigma factor [Pedobacter africanus]MDR6785728.1 RNA polymerase sigma factor (sigma-70 family) [Pedobacter africanus]
MNKKPLGDKQAFEEIYKAHFRELYRYGYQLAFDKELTLDCLQQLFTDLWDKRKDTAPIANIMAYLKTSLRNRLINALNKKHMNNRSLDELDDAQFAESPVEGLIIENETLQGHLHRLSAAFKALSPAQRKLINMRYFQELSYQQIVEQTGIGQASIYNQISIGIKVLKQAFFHPDQP